MAIRIMKSFLTDFKDILIASLIQSCFSVTQHNFELYQIMYENPNVQSELY